MKILWLSHAVPWPPKSGMLQRSYNLIQQASRSHEVHLVALNNRKLLSDGEVPAAVSALGRFCTSVRVHSVEADRSRVHRALLLARLPLSRAPYDVHWLRSPSMFADLQARVGSGVFDLVHIDTLGLWPYGAACGALPRVLTHHDVESHKMSRRACREPHPARRLYFQNEARKLAAYEKEVCPRASANVVVSLLDAARLEEVAGRLCVFVVENGVDTVYFRPSPAPVPRSLIFVGGMNLYANREAALFLMREVWPVLVEREPQRNVTIVGSDPPGKLRVLTVDPRIQITGFANDVRPHIDRAQIYVCPIFDGGGTRLKVLDALAMAKPLVATGFAVEGLGLEEERHYLRAEARDDFVRQILRLEEDELLRNQLVSEGRRLVEERYRWDVVAARLNAAYEAAMNRRAAASPSVPVSFTG